MSDPGFLRLANQLYPQVFFSEQGFTSSAGVTVFSADIGTLYVVTYVDVFSSTDELGAYWGIYDESTGAQVLGDIVNGVLVQQWHDSVDRFWPAGHPLRLGTSDAGYFDVTIGGYVCADLSAYL